MPTPVTLSSMVPDVSAHVPGCPTPVIEFTLRKIITDLCQRAKVWTTELPVVPLAASTATYVLASPLAYAEIVDIRRVRVEGTHEPLEWKSPSTLDLMYPEPVDGPPRYFTTSPMDTSITLAPTPTATADMRVTVTLRPIENATQWDAVLYREFKRCVFHGVLAELLAMPLRSWTDAKTAQTHERRWVNLVSEARWRADTSFTPHALRVEARPFA
jgi:hypothetical protein